MKKQEDSAAAAAKPGPLGEVPVLHPGVFPTGTKPKVPGANYTSPQQEKKEEKLLEPEKEKPSVSVQNDDSKTPQEADLGARGTYVDHRDALEKAAKEIADVPKNDPHKPKLDRFKPRARSISTEECDKLAFAQVSSSSGGASPASSTFESLSPEGYPEPGVDEDSVPRTVLLGLHRNTRQWTGLNELNDPVERTTRSIYSCYSALRSQSSAYHQEVREMTRVAKRRLWLSIILMIFTLLVAVATLVILAFHLHAADSFEKKHFPSVTQPDNSKPGSSG